MVKNDQLSAVRYVLDNRAKLEELAQRPTKILAARLDSTLKDVLKAAIEFCNQPGQPKVTVNALFDYRPNLKDILNAVNKEPATYESYSNLIGAAPEIDDTQTETILPAPQNGTDWTRCKVPPGFKLSERYGLQQQTDDEPITITMQPVWVEAASRDPNNDNWGLLICWFDQLGQMHRKAFSKAYLHGQPTELAKVLAAGGLQITVGRERALCQYLSLCTAGQFMTAALATGWLKEAFVLPDMTINEPNDEKIVFQPEGLSDVSKAISCAGDFHTWQKVTQKLPELPLFVVCAALSAPLRFLVNIEAGGFHLYDSSGRGKTTALQIAASVWGNGADPQIAGGNACYVQRWNATANALEAKAEHFNDLIMVVDEIGEGDSKQFGTTVYRLMAGVGRNRAGKDGNLRDSKAWRITLLSCGEIGVQQFIESGGQRAKTGQLVRIADIDCSLCPPLFSSGEESDHYKQTAATHYGHAGRHFIAALETIPNIKKDFENLPSELVGSVKTKEAARVLKRFQLACYAGLIAVRKNILNVSEQQVINAARIAFNAWLAGVSTITEPERGVDLVRNFILEHESRFQKIGDTFTPHNRAGWFRDDRYYFIPDVFNEVADGLDATKIKKALKQRKLLHVNREKGLNYNFNNGERTIQTVCVKSDILSASLNLGGNGGNGSNSPDITRPKSVTTYVDEVVMGGNNQLPNVEKLPPVTTYAREVVTPESPAISEKLPPLPPLPPENRTSTQNELATAPIYVCDDKPGFEF